MPARDTSDRAMTTVRRDWELDFNVDDVLRSQGADPEILRARRPRIVELAQAALEEGRELVEPAVLSRKLRVSEVLHNHLMLDGCKRLSGPLVVEHLARAEYVTVLVCTIGNRLPDRVIEVTEEHAVRGLALDAVGSAAVNALSTAACNVVEADAISQGQQTSLPLNPGLEDWPFEIGQREIFSMVDPSRIGVEVTPSLQMIPIKSITMVLGIGADVTAIGAICDYCGLRDSCRQRIE